MPTKIELYGVIGFDWWGDGKTAKSLNDELTAIEAADGDNDVELHINSGGGYVDDAVAMYTRLVRHPGNVTVIIDGLAASAATIVAMAGNTIQMPDNAMMMIHKPWGRAAGSAQKMVKYAEHLERVESLMVKTYLKQATELEEEELRAMLAAETWMTAEDALGHGFVDEIVEDAPEKDTEARATAAVAEYFRAAASSNGSELPTYQNAPTWARIAAESGSTLSPPARVRAQTPQQEPKMPKKTNTPAAAAQPSNSPATSHEPQANVPDDAAIEEARKQARAEERKRTLAIQAACEQHNVSAEFQRELVESDISVSAAKERILDWLGENNSGPTSSIVAGQDIGDKRFEGVQRALEIRAGLMSANEARNEYGQNPYVGMSLRQLAYDFDDHRGPKGSAIDVAGRVLNAALQPGRVYGAAAPTYTTGDFTNILSNVMHKSMLRGWDAAPATWRSWCNRGVLTDFRQASRVGLNHLPELEELPEGAEYRGTQLDDRGRTNQLATYGNILVITRQAIINDDMNAFARLPMQFGAAAARTVAGIVYAQLFANPTIESAALFSAGHDTLQTSTSLNTAGLGAMRSAMRTQKAPALPNGDAHTHTLNIQPKVLLVPAALEQDGRELINGGIIADGNAGVTNVNQGSMELVVEGRLDANATDAYYVIGDPAMYDTFEVAFLDGVETPFLERLQSSNVDGVQHKVRLDFGVAVLDFRAMQKATA